MLTIAIYRYCISLNGYVLLISFYQRACETWAKLNSDILPLLTLFHTSAFIHRAIHLSHSSLLLFQTSVPLSLAGWCLEVPSVSSTIQGGDRADEAQGRDIKHGMLALVLPPYPSSPSCPATPVPSLFELLAPPSVCAWFGAGCRRSERKGSANDKWQSQNKHTSEGGQGRGKRAESLFHHPSASVALLINLWSLPCSLLSRLSLTPFAFTISSLF